MRNLVFVSISILVFFSCKEKKSIVIHYKLNDIAVSRLDIEKRTYLYYGDCNNINFIKKKVSVLIDWRFDNFLQASLIFHEDGKVEIMTGGGGQLKMISRRDDIYFRAYESPEFNKIMDRYAPPNNLDNLCYIFDNTQFERKENIRLKSKIFITDSLPTDKVICK
jgi:hypothetical protein